MRADLGISWILGGRSPVCTNMNSTRWNQRTAGGGAWEDVISRVEGTKENELLRWFLMNWKDSWIVVQDLASI
jgi:phosphatidylserine/phosphatidylglycerophosphate/cardiolipin synthase-like enzyme